MKKALLLALLLTLTACAAPPEEEPVAETFAPIPQEDTARYLGIAAAAHINRSMHATLDFPGRARTEVTFAAVLVDCGGVIRACTIDGVDAALLFDAAGHLQTPNGTVFPSKTALGDRYGMHKASALGTEWYQQAAAFAAHCVGKTADELQTADTVTSVTISTDCLLRAVQTAAENARTAAPPETDTLTLTCRAVAEGSRSAAADSPGAARIRITAMARTPDGTEAACALLSALPFSAAGRLTCDLSQSLSPLSDVLYPTAILPTDYDAFGEILAQTG